MGSGELRLANRHSEHVACAGGDRVRTAGEMTLGWSEDGAVDVEMVSNQSTGYCPEERSWPALARALEALGLEVPEGWTYAMVFRFCETCHERNIVKDGWFWCGACGASLPPQWNFG